MLKLTAGILLVLTGCATQWAKPGASPQALEADTATCRSKAEVAIPVVPLMMSTGWATPPRRECAGGDRNSCTNIPGVPAAPRMVDQNEQLRMRAIDACLKEMGWTR